MQILINFIIITVLKIYLCDIEVSSDAAAAVKQQGNGQKQTFISSQSKAKSGKESLYDPKSHQDTNVISSDGSDTDLNNKDELQWGYSNHMNIIPPDKWKITYPVCNGSMQSPIALQAEQIKSAEKYLKPLTLTGLDKEGLLFGNIMNTGHTFGVEINSNRTIVKISGGPLQNKEYQLWQFHFHYSCDNKVSGSEHSMDGLKYLAELHFVFWNLEYGSPDNSIDKPDGLVVLGFFIKSSTAMNYGTFVISRYLIDIANPRTQLTLPYGLSLYDLVKSLRDGIGNLNYVTYQGSLTTPPCYESVTWIVFQDPIKIPNRDIESWRKLNGLNGEKLCDNVRPLQSLNNRQMFFIGMMKPVSSAKKK